MDQTLGMWRHIEQLTWEHVLLVAAVVIAARLLSMAIRRFIRRAAERAAPRFRLSILRAMPVIQLTIVVGAMIIAVPIMVEPTVPNITALVAGSALGLVLALKDYGSSMVAGLVTVLENTYQPGDWIEIDGTYGEVKSITLRAVHLVTADDSAVTVPHAALWNGSVSNATSGSRSLLCVADFYLHPDHDAAVARDRLAKIGEVSSYRRADTPVSVIVIDQPWGTKYRLKAYVNESRDQFLFITDLTVRGKAALLAMGARFAQAPYAATNAG